MVKKVIKKEGQKEDFDLEKIRKSLYSFLSTFVEKEEEKKEIIEKILEEVMKFVKNKEEIYAAEIEAKIILELEKIYPHQIERWREYRLNKEK
jgi:transcriptional regulator NrdR family protein